MPPYRKKDGTYVKDTAQEIPRKKDGSLLSGKQQKHLVLEVPDRCHALSVTRETTERPIDNEELIGED